MDYEKLSGPELEAALAIAKKFKLDSDQLSIAWKVRNESIKQGVNPDFVLPMVMAESGFDPKATSDKDAFGVMQLTPDTAKGLKVDRNDLDENIRGGVSLLKELTANKKIGYDPYKVLAGYNASTESRNKFYETGNLDDLPTETLKHMLKVSNFYGGKLPSLEYQEPKTEAVEEPAAPVNAEAAKMAEKANADNDLSMAQEAAIMAPIGGAAGVSLGAGKKLAFDIGHRVYDAVLNPEHPAPVVTQPQAEVTSMPVRTPQTPATGTLTTADKQVLGTGDKGGMTGRESQTGYTEKTAQQAARKDVQQQVSKDVGLNPKRTFAEFPDVASTKGGVLASKKTLDDIEMQRQMLRDSYAKRALAKAQAVGSQWQAMQAKIEADAAAKAAHEAKWLTRAKNAAAATARGFRGSLPGTLGAMGFGAGAAFPLATEEYQQGNSGKAAATLGTGAGLGYAATKFPKVAGPLSAAALAAYQVTHPREVSAEMRYHDINPTAFMGMPEQAEYAFPDQR